jgi:hypothetical protein
VKKKKERKQIIVVTVKLKEFKIYIRYGESKRVGRRKVR